MSREAPAVILPYADDDDHDGVPKLLEYAFGMHLKSRDAIPLKVIHRDLAVGSGSYDIEVRLRADNALATKVLVSENLTSWDEVSLIFQSGNWQTNSPNITVSEAIPQEDGLSIIRLKAGPAPIFAATAALGRMSSKFSASTRAAGRAGLGDRRH